jgi:hypothetical protein
MSFFRKLCGGSSSRHNNDDFHPDHPPSEPYPGANPYHSAPIGDAKTAFAPPPGPPPKGEAPPEYATLPADEPPPAFHGLHLTSPTSNAPADLADAGWDFTDANPLSLPSHFTLDALDSISRGEIGLAPPPPGFQGLITSRGLGRIDVASQAGLPATDSCLVSALPLYAAGYHYRKGKTAYFEVDVERMPRDAAVAIGFVAVPYPGFRLPGWNRGSLGVHGDDGRRYVNDAFGGRDFTGPFREGERVGLGMRWAEDGTVEVWFTRQGKRVGGWRLDEHRDAREENDPLPGLDGASDVYAAVGIFGGGVKVQVRFLPEGEAVF